ncbi:MAG: ribosome silencing factor [Anaerolineae bacterium]|nr:ribosome silencing factor [Anaerolineae bacterium]
MEEIILDKQGEDILVLDLREVTTIADYFIICSGTSSRQVDAIYNGIREGLKQSEDIVALHAEGTSNSGWILMDYNGVIVHIFSPDTRDYYRLEELWKNARVVVRIQ